MKGSGASGPGEERSDWPAPVWCQRSVSRPGDHVGAGSRVLVGCRWRLHHCDYYGMDMWGRGTSVTVSSGKNTAPGFHSPLFGFLSTQDWFLGHVPEGTHVGWPGGVRDWGASLGFQMPEENWNKV